MKKILITGAGSYIGEKTKDYLMAYPDKYLVDIKDTMNWIPQVADFIGYDVVFNVAGIAHIKENAGNRHLYYEINRDLVVKIAKAAKAAGVHQFILLSTMSVYGLTVGIINKKTEPNPVNAYGESKVQADEEIKKLEDDSFLFACLRPPMVYGKGCKGNYQRLRQFALKSPIFPNYKNQRSMIYIDNLCDFIKTCIDNEKSGLFFPQNKDYVRTSAMVETIARYHKRNIRITKVFNWAIRLLNIEIVKKVFGSLVYEDPDGVDKFDFEESIAMTEN